MTKPAEAHYGIDIGGSKMELVAYGDAALLQERFRKRVATPGHSFEAFLDAVCGLVQDADAALGLQGSVGLGAPGVTDPRTGRQLSSNVPALNGQALAPALQARLGRPVAIGNDCQCFALSEAHGGAAAAYPSMFGAIIGTGAGGGFCQQGQLLRGRNGLAGEWGHSALPALLQQKYQLPLWSCACGLTGCLERYVSGTGYAALYRHFAGLGAAEGLDVPAIEALAEAAEPLALNVREMHLDLLAYGLAQLVLIEDPHVIVLGGGLSKLQRLYAQLPEAMSRHLFASVQVPEVLPPRFGDAAGTRGAALLGMQRTHSA